MAEPEDFAARFDTRVPDEDGIEEIRVLKRHFADLATYIQAMPRFRRREQALAITKLEEACHWAVRARVVEFPVAD